MVRQLFVLLLCLITCSFLITSQVLAQTKRYVDNLGNCAAAIPCYPTIMDAVDASSPSDVIAVFPGVYPETVVIPQGKDNIVLKARYEAQMPVIAVPASPPPPYTRGLTLYAFGVQVLNFVIEAGVNGIGPGGFRAVIQGNRVGYPGIGFIHCRSSTVKDNWVLGAGIGVNQDCSDCMIIGNRVEGGIGIVGAGYSISGNVIRRNTVRGHDITLSGESYQNMVESNQVEAGSIVLSSEGPIDQNVIHHNVVRGGGIELRVGWPTFYLSSNTIEANFVSGSPAWRDNRFETACGAASQSGVKLREAPSPWDPPSAPTLR